MPTARAVDVLPRRCRAEHSHLLKCKLVLVPKQRSEQPGGERIAGPVGIQLAGERERRDSHLGSTPAGPRACEGLFAPEALSHIHDPQC